MLPRLIHPIPVRLRKPDRAVTLQDHNLREPIGQAYRMPEVRLLAQVWWGTDSREAAAEVGSTSSSDGYLLFRTHDLRERRFELGLGDRVSQIGDGAAAQATDLYVCGMTWMGHYPDQRGATLVKAWFEDRSPGKQR